MALNKRTWTVQDIAHHRNGIAGEGFYVLLFTSEGESLVGIVFEAPGHCAVFNPGRLYEGTIAFGENSYRGDVFERWLREQIQTFEAGRSLT